MLQHQITGDNLDITYYSKMLMTPKLQLFKYR